MPCGTVGARWSASCDACGGHAARHPVLALMPVVLHPVLAKKMCIPNASRLCFGPSLWSCQQQQTLDADTLARFSNSKPTQHVQTFLRGLAATPTSICTLSCASFVHLLEQSKTSHHISFCFWPLWLLVDA